MKTNQLLKAELYEHCVAFVESRLDTIKTLITEIEVALQSETKSSAGDKHETGRAMMQLEREKAGNQLAEILKTKSVLERIQMPLESNRIGMGSLVYTTQSNYFISISAGKIDIENQTFFAISPNTPIGLLLMGKAKDDEVQFRNAIIRITTVI